MTDIANSTVKIQIESLQTGNPTSESSLIALGGGINYSLDNRPAVGDVVLSALDEATFQAQRNTTWVLCDGRNVGGSTYQTLTSQTNIPDFRATFPRGKDQGRGLDPHGDLAIGAFQNDQFLAHTHQEHYRIPTVGPGGSAGGGDTNRGLQDIFENVTTTGGSETNPKATVINFFIKINT